MQNVTTQERVLEVLKGVIIPFLNKNIVEANYVKEIRLDAQQRNIELFLTLNFHSATYNKQLEAECKALLVRHFDSAVAITIENTLRAHKVQDGLKPIKTIKNIIVVASGKGGVGKSTTSVNLALALQREGVKVGVLDADIYGPSLPRMIGAHGRPESRDNKSMEPIIAGGIETMSIGYLIDEKEATIWRAPMAVSALTQLLQDTNWGMLDYLIIDMPPGTGDIQLTLAQKIPVAGSVIVTTPQDIALIDARKGINMFEKVNVPILGIIENMSTHICSQCQHEEAIFGADGGDRLAKEAVVPLLGKLPLDIRIRQSLDVGTPQSLDASEITLRYQEIALNIMMQLSLRPKDVAGKFPNIVVENK